MIWFEIESKRAEINRKKIRIEIIETLLMFRAVAVAIGCQR